MEIVFLGVGEACDPDNPNTSLLVKSDRHQVMLDCGFTTPHIYFKTCDNADELDALWISHFHGDHFFGVPLLLLRFWEMGRGKPISIIGRPGTEDLVSRAMELAYPGLMPRFDYPVRFIELSSGDESEAVGFLWRAAENDHPEPCLAVRLEQTGKSMFYSGDGRPNPETIRLAAGCDLAVHEAFRVSGETPGHGTVAGCLEFARRAGVEAMALLHVQRQERAGHEEEIRALLVESGLKVFLPESGDRFQF